MARKTAIMMVVISALLVGGAAQGSILIGSGTTPVEQLADLNALITVYNTANTTSFNLITSQVDKLDGFDKGVFFEGGKLSIGDFNFYERNDLGSFEQNIFDTANVPFAAIDLVPAGGDNNVFGFEYSGDDVSFDYYVVKSGLGGTGNSYSLWAYTTPIDGFPLNPAYTDAGTVTGDSRIDQPAFVPVGNAVSHISYWTSNGGGILEEIPEPSGFVVWALIGLVAVGGSRLASKRRNRK